MISFVKGTLERNTGQMAIVEAGGIGYGIHISSSTANRLPERGQMVKLYTHLQVREDNISLHGFMTHEELRMFEMLITVSGIGPKAATAILATLTPEQLILAVIAEDEAALTKAQGIGRKTAQRITLELRDKMHKFREFAEDDSMEQLAIPMQKTTSEKQDALDALQTLGFSRSESLKAIMESAEEGLNAEEIIRRALHKLSKGNQI